MEANPDIYGLAPHALDDLQTLAVSSYISNTIDWQRVSGRAGTQGRLGSRRHETGSDPHLAHVEPPPNLEPTLSPRDIFSQRSFKLPVRSESYAPSLRPRRQFLIGDALGSA